MDSLFYTIFSPNNKLLVLRHIKITPQSGYSGEFFSLVNEVLKKDDLLRLNYKSCHAAYSSNKATLIPNRLFDTTELNTYLNQVTTVNAKEGIYYDDLPVHASKLVFAVHSNLITFVKSIQPNAKLMHRSTAHIEGVKRYLSKKAIANAVCIDVQTEVMQILVIKDNELQLLNHYPYFSEQDCLYYTSLVFNQLQLSTEGTPLLLSGQINSNDAYGKLLNRYINNIQFMPPDGTLKINNGFDHSPKHQYFTLFSLSHF